MSKSALTSTTDHLSKITGQATARGGDVIHGVRDLLDDKEVLSEVHKMLDKVGRRAYDAAPVARRGAQKVVKHARSRAGDGDFEARLKVLEKALEPRKSQNGALLMMGVGIGVGLVLVVRAKKRAKKKALDVKVEKTTLGH